MQIVIVDLGSQYTQLIGRELRELGYRSVVVSPQKVHTWLKEKEVRGIILSGGAASIYDKNAPRIPSGLLSSGLPILGICLGMHWLAKKLGGAVEQHRGAQEYGEARLTLKQPVDPLLKGVRSVTRVWASHGDSVVRAPRGFRAIASTRDCSIAAMSSVERKIWCVQFHPEVKDTHSGSSMLKNFLIRCGCLQDWQPANIIQKIQEEFRMYPARERFLLGFSGGVDSTTLAAILKRVLRGRLSCLTIDAGNLREGEITDIHRSGRAAGCRTRVVNVRGDFIGAISQTIDAQGKRKIFQGLYRDVLEKQSANCQYLVQATLAPDVIESAGVGNAAVIKTHHNVGFSSRMIQLHPFQNLFKYEVRELARHLNLPSSVVERRPFPGPGLFVRVVGIPVGEESLALVRWADAVVQKIIEEEKIGGDLSQLVVALLGILTTGVKGDSRSYGYAIGVRGITTSDFMTGRGYQFPADVRRHIQQELTRHRAITRVWFDEGDKPPATVEFE